MSEAGLITANINRLTSSSSTSKTKGKNAHRHNTLTLSAVDIGVRCEDVRDGLWCVGQVCVGHCDGCMYIKLWASVKRNG